MQNGTLAYQPIVVQYNALQMMHCTGSSSIFAVSAAEEAALTAAGEGNATHGG